MSAATALRHLKAYMREMSAPAPARRKHLMAATDALWDARPHTLESAARALIDHGRYQGAVTLLEAATNDLTGQSDEGSEPCRPE